MLVVEGMSGMLKELGNNILLVELMKDVLRFFTVNTGSLYTLESN
jgi:hypothetical protein